jgi:N-acetylmuramate 1-kinase
MIDGEQPVDNPGGNLIAWALAVLGLPAGAPVSAVPLTKGGSDRRFYRLRWNGRSVLLMRYLHERRENSYYAPIGRFLREIGVAVPEIFHHDAAQGFLLLEDLGDEDLWSCRQAPWEVRQELYEKTLVQIQRLHAYPLTAFSRAGIPVMDGFDAALYRWERDYFAENFVGGVCGITMSSQRKRALEEELGALARRLAAATPALIHRDFQSQNVMLRSREPVLIDFQGMRLGNPLYDVGSLLYDPYVAMTEDERMVLLARYHALSGAEWFWPDLQEAFREASAQRLMQALGAYGFLGLKKGRPAFLRHCASATRNLAEATREDGRLTLLHVLALECRQAVREGPYADSP